MPNLSARKHSALILCACLILMLAGMLGCRKAAPVYNVNDVDLSPSSSRTMAAMTSAIKEACTVRGWQIKEAATGHIIATLNVRGKHVAMVDIIYTVDRFSITYRDSMNLEYSGGSIHPQYNAWVRNLEQAIRIRASNI